MTEYQPTPPPATPYGAGPVAPTDRYNVLAIVGFVLAFVVSLGAVICGHIALGQIKRTGEKGHGLALAAVILGYVGILIGIIWIVVVILAVAAGVGSGSFSSSLQ